MTSQALRARAEARGGAPSIARQLQRFRPEIQDAVAVLAARHERLADLALSFPALLVALAWPNARFDPRPVIDGAVAGVPLAALARAARLPLWLRKLEPRSLIAPLPAMPDGGFIAHRIVNHLPAHPAQAQAWFEAVSLAHRWVDDCFALWCAREFAAAKDARQSRRRRRRANRWRGSVYRLPLLCLWAWYSGRPDTPAGSLVEMRWHPQMQLGAAWAGANAWLELVELDLFLGGRKIDDVLVLHEPGLEGFTFEPLFSRSSIAAEGTAMRNCVRSYGPALARDSLRLWSMRKDGARVATLAVGWPTSDPLPVIEDLKLVGNIEAPPELWWIARRWLHAHDVRGMIARRLPWNSPVPDRAGWLRLWKPFWLAKGRVPAWLPLGPSSDALRNL